MSDVDEQIFPVLTVTTAGFLAAFIDRKSLETCGQWALRSGYFDGLLVVDSSGQSWEVQHVQKVGNVGPLGGWRLMQPRLIRVKFDLSQGDRFDLDGLKNRVCEAIQDLPVQWEAAEDIGDTKARVRSAADIPTLIQMFLGQA